MQVLGCLLGFFIILFFILIALVRGAWNLLLGKTLFKHTGFGFNPNTSQDKAQGQTNGTASSSAKRRDKVIDDNEGEYVDFEEIKH